MSQPRQPGRYRLDDLLARLPVPGPEPTSAEWASKLEHTLQRVRRLDGAEHRDAESQASADSNEDLISKTPLPVEAGEPEPIVPCEFDAKQGAIYDELRAPLQSGEHAPLALSALVQAPNATLADSRDFSPALPASNRTYWISGALGTLAIAAAFAIWLRHPDRSPAAELVVSEHAERVESNHASTLSEPAANPTVVASPQTADLPLEAKATPGHGTTALHGGPGSSRAKSANAPALPETASSPTEPELVPAAGPSNLMDHPSTGAISAALARRIPEAQRCLPRTVPTTGVRLTFGSSGMVQGVEILNSAVAPDTRACLQRTLATVRLEPFARAQFDVTATISLPATKSSQSGR
jgi:hypothetical protein